MNRTQLIKKMEGLRAELQNDNDAALNVGDAVTCAMHALEFVQSTVSAAVPGCITEGQPTKDQLRTYTLAMIVELGEFIQTLDWKPWKDKQDFDKSDVTYEFADILAFMGVLVVYLRKMGITPEDIGDAYVAKSITNIERFLGEREECYNMVGGAK